MVEGARLESEYTAKPYRGFESLPLRHFLHIVRPLAMLVDVEPFDLDLARRRASPGDKDDVLGRCLAMQAAGEPGFSNAQIRTALMGFIVVGPPQPPMVVLQALKQLLRRPDALPFVAA